MTDPELQAYVRALALAVADLQNRLTRLEAFALSTHKRLLVNEVEVLAYEDENDAKGELH